MDAAPRIWSTEAMTATPREGLVRLTHIIYGLHAFSAVMGVISSAAVVTAFLTGWPSILAVILNYVKRADVRGTYLESHFRWQIRTFWFAALWVAVALSSSSRSSVSRSPGSSWSSPASGCSIGSVAAGWR